MIATIVWLAGFALLLVWLALAAARTRASTEQTMTRAAVILAAAFVALLGFSSAYVWGIGVGNQGMARILASAPDRETGAGLDAPSDLGPGAGSSRAEPPRARLFLRHVQLLLGARAGADQTGQTAGRTPHTGIIGYSPEAALRLPRSYGLAEAKQGWDILRATATGPQGLRIEAIAHPEATTTRVFIHVRRRAITASPAPASIADTARSLVGRGSRRCRPDPPGAGSAMPSAGEIDGPGTIYAILCDGRTPKATLVFERDLAASESGAATTALRVTPLVWRGNRWRPHHVQIASGSLIQIGTMADALPGVTLWEVPAPAGRAELFFPPTNLLASCPEWLSGRQGEGFFSHPTLGPGPGPGGDLGARDSMPESQANDSICVLPFTPPFGLEVRRLLPDLPGIGARSLWAAGLMTTPALLLLLLLCAQMRSQIAARRFYRLLALGWISVFLAAVAVWRLLWAHRIDMLRDYESVGTRVLQNQVVLVLAGAALAATCVLAWNHSKNKIPWRGLATAAIAWLIWLMVGGYALRGDVAGLSINTRLMGQALVSLVVGTAIMWLPMLRRAATLAGERAATGWNQRAMSRPWLADPWIVPAAGLFALCVLIAAADALAPRAVVLKLGLAWTLVLFVYMAVRAAIASSHGPGARTARPLAGALAGFFLGALGAVLMARFDPGVTVAIAGPGLIAALVFASHDARFADASLRQIDSYRRHHAPLVLAHAGLLGLLGVIIAGWSLAGLLATTHSEPDAMLSRTLTLGTIHLILFLAILFVPAAALAYLRRGTRAAIPWLVAAALLAGMWAMRGPLVNRVLGSSTQAANRIAIVLDPGYALLRSESKFLSGITAWRETIVPPDASAPDAMATHSAAQLINGQGYFGAQLIDPGVLLSIENDYFPVLLLREAGIRGVVETTLMLLLLVAGLWIVSGNRFRHGSASQRARALAAMLLGVVCIYQPLASLGGLPLTGIAWPGFGLDSPSDFWLLLILMLWVLVWSSARDRERDQPRLEAFDAELRASRLFRRVGAVVAMTAAIAVLASLLLICRAAAFALRRPSPVDARGLAVKPFDGLEHAIDYAYTLQCPWSAKTVPRGPDAAGQAAAALIPDDLLGDPEHQGILRFHSALRASWQAHRGRAVVELATFLAQGTGCGDTGTRRSGPWTFARSADNASECRLRFKSGWPEIELAIERNPGQAIPSYTASCTVDVRADVLRQLRFPARRPYRNARVRLVSRAMGAAARDLGELLSGHLVVRLRPGAGAADVSRASTGLYMAEEVRISDQLSVTVQDGAAVLRRAPQPAPASADSEAWLFMRNPPGSATRAAATSRVQVLEADEGSWRLLPTEVTEVPLTRLALLVVGGPDARSLWLFRPPTEWPGEAAAVHPLLADDIATVRGERRRHYLFGGLIPELGWVNPYHARMSLGLDGWVHVAMSEYEEQASAAAPRVPTWLDSGEEVPYCGTLNPWSEQTPAAANAAGSAQDPGLDRICHQSPLDGVLECRVSVQPELGLRLHHLLELASLDPVRFSGDGRAVPSVHAGFSLVRGDTGELVAQGEFVPGRASTAYAPATPEIEQHLIRLREDRDPRTGRKLPVRGQSSAEKIEWAQPIAVGSTMKPLLGRALELADAMFARALLLDGAKMAGARCRGRKVHAIFGHCPPTDSLWNRTGLTDMSRFLSDSINWFQAAVGLLGTAVPRGEFGFGEDGAAVDLSTILTKNVGDYRPQSALWTRHKGKQVIAADHTIRLDALRKTAMWQRFEELLGRPLCMAGNKTLCRRRHARRDLCAVRALPIQKPTRDLRHLVATGPGAFDFYPQLADPSRRVGPAVNIREYLQFLRGSGLHPLGSLIQLTGAFNRLVFQYDRDPAESGYSLAESWFPVAATGTIPGWQCGGPAQGRDVKSGICAVVESGTARATLGPLLDDDRFVIYGAKTGTIDSLADVAERRDACAHFATGHTVTDQPAESKKQPYWLACNKRRADKTVNDSLLIISFAVRAGTGASNDDGDLIPLTLGLRFQRSGPGFAARVTAHFLATIYAYFAPAGATPDFSEATQ